MRVAIPVWEDKVSPVFDTALRLLIVEVEDWQEASRFETSFAGQDDISRRCLRIRELTLDILICGAISQPFSNLLTASGIDIIAEISGHAEDILDAYLQGNLSHSRFLMPGCKRLKSKDNRKPRGRRRKGLRKR